jgi:hypothetical protein
MTEPAWFQYAVFYEVLVPTFADGNADGVGDLAGLTSKLQYLHWLGDCLWLPPFYPSPWRYGGYDVTDYRDVHPQVGTLPDFTAFLERAHELGLRVIVDFVANHTSDQHPWFQVSRRDPGGPYGQFYVWADDDRGYPKAPIIFPDAETSNWAFDPIRKQYYRPYLDLTAGRGAARMAGQRSHPTPSGLQFAGDRCTGIADRAGDHVDRTETGHVWPPVNWSDSKDRPLRSRNPLSAGSVEDPQILTDVCRRSTAFISFRPAGAQRTNKQPFRSRTWPRRNGRTPVSVR